MLKIKKIGTCMFQEKYKSAIIRTITFCFPDAKIYLFGSRATGTAKEGSDIDIAIDAGKKISYLDLDRARRIMNEMNIPYEVDIVDLHAVPDELRLQILSEGLLWKN